MCEYVYVGGMCTLYMCVIGMRGYRCVGFISVYICRGQGGCWYVVCVGVWVCVCGGRSVVGV